MNGEGNNNNYDKESYAYEILNPNGKPKTKLFSIIALVFGILSVAFCSAAYFAIIVAVAAIVFAVISRIKLGYFDGMTIAGLIIAIFGLVLGIFMVIAINVIDPEFLKEFFEMYGESMPDIENTNPGGSGAPAI